MIVKIKKLLYWYLISNNFQTYNAKINYNFGNDLISLLIPKVWHSQSDSELYIVRTLYNTNYIGPYITILVVYKI
jgi:hypothetical protein